MIAGIQRSYHRKNLLIETQQRLAYNYRNTHNLFKFDVEIFTVMSRNTKQVQFYASGHNLGIKRSNSRQGMNIQADSKG